MPGAPPRFLERFERIVGPILADIARVQGTFVALGIATYSQAHAEIMHEAQRRGAAFLPADAGERLEDWAHDALLAEIDRGDRLLGDAERQMHDDPTAFWLSVWRPIWAKDAAPPT